jgi:UDP-N-acetyl-D-mannosaminuronic acid dehydrogenase
LNKLKVSVIGLGYIGLPTAAVLASRKIEVIGVDVNKHAVDLINQGKIHIVEPELNILVSAAVQSGYLRATMQVEKADVFMVAVPTPFKGNHEPDLSYIQSAAESIAPVLEKGNLVILESTSPVGATENMVEWMQNVRPDLQFPLFGECSTDVDVAVAHCPERVLPGHVVRELIENDRVIGGVTSQCATKAQKYYKLFVEGDCLITDCRTAELTKLTENSFRDVNIAFANELSLICDKHNIDVWELIKLANRHPRVNILQPGPGVGGHCIAVDPWFIVDSAPEEAKLIATARYVNDSKPEWVVKKVMETINENNIKDPIIACLGLSYKPDIDDTRESPAIEIVKKLLKENIHKIIVIEPNIEELPGDLNDNSIKFLKDSNNSLVEADVLLVLVNHKEFKEINRKNHPNKVFLNIINNHVSP